MKISDAIKKLQNRGHLPVRVDGPSDGGAPVGAADAHGAGYLPEAGPGAQDVGEPAGPEGGAAAKPIPAPPNAKDQLERTAATGSGHQNHLSKDGADPGAGGKQLAAEGGPGLILTGAPTTYLVVGKSGGEVEYTYKNGWLAGVDIKTDMNWHSAQWIWQSLIGGEEDFKTWLKSLGKAIQVINRVPVFEDFWRQQRRKEKKLRAEREWKALSDADKSKALSGLNRFYARKSRTGEALPYPDMYLKDRRWEDE